MKLQFTLSLCWLIVSVSLEILFIMLPLTKFSITSGVTYFFKSGVMIRFSAFQNSKILVFSGFHPYQQRLKEDKTGYFRLLQQQFQDISSRF